jgi:hypothetical protein
MTVGSYLLIEPGMTIQGADGHTIGTVTELVADENADIFRGIVAHLASARSSNEVVFMPGEHITAVESQTVFTDLDLDRAAQLEAVEPGASAA